jgi:hypothetical protein
MSEFKFACPVCGQHMMCDASQAGSVMDCPTCFQKIIAPQAPGPDVKFIITGTQLTEKKISVPELGAPAPVEKKFPAGLVLGLLLAALGAGAAGFYIYSQKNPPPVPPPGPVAHEDNPAPAKPAPVAPPASDANWSLDLGTNEIATAPVAGRIHAQDFIIERASFQNGSLMLRAGTHGPVEFAAFINFGGAQAESLSGQSINVTADTDKAAKISLRWKDAAGAVQKENWDNGYAMRLEFGALANNRLPGKIYLCTPDKEKSYLIGSFSADARKPKPPKPKK